MVVELSVNAERTNEALLCMPDAPSPPGPIGCSLAGPLTDGGNKFDVEGEFGFALP